MHSIEMRPLAAPDEAVPLEDVNDLERHTVSISAFGIPEPVIRKVGIEINGGGPGVHAAVAGILDRAAVERARARNGVTLQTGRKPIKLLCNGAQFVGY